MQPRSKDSRQNLASTYLMTRAQYSRIAINIRKLFFLGKFATQNPKIYKNTAKKGGGLFISKKILLKSVEVLFF